MQCPCYSTRFACLFKPRMTSNVQNALRSSYSSIVAHPKSPPLAVDDIWLHGSNLSSLRRLANIRESNGLTEPILMRTSKSMLWYFNAMNAGEKVQMSIHDLNCLFRAVVTNKHLHTYDETEFRYLKEIACLIAQKSDRKQFPSWIKRELLRYSYFRSPTAICHPIVRLKAKKEAIRSHLLLYEFDPGGRLLSKSWPPDKRIRRHWWNRYASRMIKRHHWPLVYLFAASRLAHIPLSKRNKVDNDLSADWMHIAVNKCFSSNNWDEMLDIVTLLRYDLFGFDRKIGTDEFLEDCLANFSSVEHLQFAFGILDSIDDAKLTRKDCNMFESSVLRLMSQLLRCSYFATVRQYTSPDMELWRLIFVVCKKLSESSICASAEAQSLMQLLKQRLSLKKISFRAQLQRQQKDTTNNMSIDAMNHTTHKNSHALPSIKRVDNVMDENFVKPMPKAESSGHVHHYITASEVFSFPINWENPSEFFDALGDKKLKKPILLKKDLTELVLDKLRELCSSPDSLNVALNLIDKFSKILAAFNIQKDAYCAMVLLLELERFGCTGGHVLQSANDLIEILKALDDKASDQIPPQWLDFKVLNWLKLYRERNHKNVKCMAVK